MPTHILIAALLATSPAIAPEPKEPAVYATIKLEKDTRAWPVEFSPDGKTLAYVIHLKEKLGEKIVLWDVAKKEVGTTLDAERYLFRSLSWEPDGKGFIANDLTSVCRVDARTGKSETLYNHSNLDYRGSEVYVMRYLPERKLIVSGGEDGLVRFWDTEKGKELKAVRCVPDKLSLPLAIPVPPGANKVIVAAESGTETRDEAGKLRSVQLQWSTFAIDLKDFSVSTILKGSPSLRRQELVELRAGDEFAYGNDEQRVVFTDAATLKTRTTRKCPIHPCQLLFTPNCRYLIASGPFPIPPIVGLFTRPGGIAVYDLATEKWVAHWQVRGDGTSCSVSYSESNNLLAYAEGDSLITIWDMKGVIDPAAKPKAKKKD